MRIAVITVATASTATAPLARETFGVAAMFRRSRRCRVLRCRVLRCFGDQRLPVRDDIRRVAVDFEPRQRLVERAAV